MTTRNQRSRSHGTDAPAPASPQDAPDRLAARQARAAGAALARYGIAPPDRVLDLCCGLGRQALTLARIGYRVTGVDVRSDNQILAAWRAARHQQPNVEFISADVRDLPLRQRHAAALLLHNSLALFHTNEAAAAVLDQVRRAIGRRGVLLIDNVCLSLWREIAAGRYADGISEDGLWQMIWLAGRNIFALRHGPRVRPGHPRPRPGEILYRAWSLDELGLLCRLTGWQIDPDSLGRPMLVARPE